MMIHTEISPTELADRLATRELVDALRALRRSPRRRGAEGALHGGHPLRHLHERTGLGATQALDGREAPTPIFDDLRRYQATRHFDGQSTIALDGDRASGESYCIAHHLLADGGKRKMMVAWLRYGDEFVKVEGAWLFAERKLYVDWTETRPSSP
jgi:hypothetical protein